MADSKFDEKYGPGVPVGGVSPVDFSAKYGPGVPLSGGQDAPQQQNLDTGAWTALGRGYGRGLTLGWADELKGLKSAEYQALINAGNRVAPGLTHFLGDMVGVETRYPEDPVEMYKRTVRDERQLQDYEDKNHAGMATAGKILGGVNLAGAASGAAPVLAPYLGGQGATLGTTMLGGAGLGMIQGAGDSKRALTEAAILKDMGVGGALGAGGGALGFGISKGIEKIPAAISWLSSKADDAASSWAVKGAGAQKSDLNKFMKKAGANADDKLHELGGEFIERELVKPGGNYAYTKDAAEKLLQQSGDEIGGILKNADAATGGKINLESITGRLDDFYNGLNSAEKESAKPWIEKILNYAAQESDAGTGLAGLNAIKGTVGDQLYGVASDKVAYKLGRNALGILSDEIKQQSARALAGGAFDDAAIATARQSIDAPFKSYYVASKAQELADEGLKRMGGNQMFGLKDALAGGTGTVAGVSALGPAGVLAGPVGAILNKVARERGPQTAAIALDRIAKFLPKMPVANNEQLLSALGQKAIPLIEAAARSQQELATAVFIMKEKDQDFRRVIGE